MTGTNIPEIVTLETLNIFKDSLFESLHLIAEDSTRINSIIQVGVDCDNNLPGETKNTIKVKDSVILGSNHIADTLNNVFITGRGNIATANNQTILGQFNEPDATASFIIGNGTGTNNRHNILTINPNNILQLNGLTIQNTNDNIFIQPSVDTKNIICDKLKLKNALNFSEDDSEFIFQVLALDDADVIPASIAKHLVKAFSLYLGDDSSNLLAAVNDLKNWQSELVQNVSYDGDDAEVKALSVAAGKELKEQITNLNAADIAGINNQIAQLKKQISYLISCLTVDKISNSSYKNEDDPLIEYYAVGLTDFAFDLDTKFKLAEN